MRAREIITEGRDALLYHGYGFDKLKYASQAIATNQMAATSTQRFWPDGRRRRERVDPDYEQSYWMKGISTSRDMRYAMEWGDIVFGLNQAKIAQRYKIIPYSWSFHMSGEHKVDMRKEREEYIVLKATPDDYHKEDEDTGERKFELNRFLSKGGPEGFMPLGPVLEGIWMHVNVATMWEPKPQEYNHETGKRERPPGHVQKEYYNAEDMEKFGFSIQQFIDHPKFKGFFEGGRRGDPPGFKFFPPNTPRDKLPPRNY